MSVISNAAISTFVQALIAALPPDLAKRGLDSLLDVVEDAVARSDTQVDDALVLPLCATLRKQLNIPEFDV